MRKRNGCSHKRIFISDSLKRVVYVLAMQLTVETFIKTITQTPFKPFTGIQRARFDFHDNHNKLEKNQFPIQEILQMIFHK